MGNKKTILICLNYFQIGGVETFAYNQTITFIKKGFNVVVLGKPSVYFDKFKSTGAKCIEFEFEDIIYYDYEKIKSFIKILKEYNVSVVYNHVFQSMNTVMMSCFITNIPYVVYIHMSESVIKDEFDFFEKHYMTYKENIEMFYKFAERIIVITPKIKEFIEKKYNIKEKNKVLYIRNSIDFDEYNSNCIPNEIKRFLIISRLDELKKNSVIEGIKLYNDLSKDKPDITLSIAGDGATEKEIKEFIIKKNIKNVTFLGAISNVKEEIEKCDAVIGVGRCILEAVAMKRLAIISGYTGIRDILTIDNFDIELDDNFSGKHLSVNEIKTIVDKIKKMTYEEIKHIVEYNYKRAKKILDINENIYIIDDYMCDYSKYYDGILQYMIKINNKIGKLEEYRFEKSENDWKEHLKYKEYMKMVLKQKEEDSQKEIEMLSKEIKMYENSKPIRLSNKIKKVLGMKGKKQ